MKCYLIRDLLPLYLEGDCSHKTIEVMNEHLRNCHECKELVELMNEPLDIKKLVGQETSVISPNSAEVWEKYYGTLIAKGAGLFITIYIVVVLVAFIV